MKAGRNDPCPCGSGKKYKFGEKDEVVNQDFLWHRVKHAIQDMPKLLRFTEKQYGQMLYCKPGMNSSF